MRTHAAAKLIFVTLLALAGATANATIIVYGAQLTGAAEAPPNASPGTGTAVVTIDDALFTMRVQVTFSGLTGTTTASHIHCCTAVPGVSTAGVATTTPSFVGFPLGVTAGAQDMTYDMTLASSYNPSFITAHGGTALSAFAYLLPHIANGEAYLNIHTSTFGGGEIRGFLVPVPEPASLSLMALGLLGAGFARRRKAA